MATVFPAYPASTLAQAEDLIIFTGNQLGDIVNGDSLSEVETVDGFIPTIRKTLVDNFGFKSPIDWSVGSNETVYNQLRKFTDGSWWWAPLATTSNPIAMTADPYTNTDWKVFTKEQVTTFENTKRLAAEAGYNLVGTFYFGTTITSASDVVLNEKDGRYYSWGGTLPKVVAAGSSPVPISSTEWVDRSYASFVTPREALRRSYAEAGYNLVVGSFEEGGTLTTINDVLLCRVNGKAYSWLGTYPVDGYIVGAGSSPVPESPTMWVDRSEQSTFHYFEKYGAVGDGVTDNTTAFAAAKAALGITRECRLGEGKTYYFAGSRPDLSGLAIYAERGAQIKTDANPNIKTMTLLNDVTINNTVHATTLVKHGNVNHDYLVSAGAAINRLSGQKLTKKLFTDSDVTLSAITGVATKSAFTGVNNTTYLSWAADFASGQQGAFIPFESGILYESAFRHVGTATINISSFRSVSVVCGTSQRVDFAVYPGTANGKLIVQGLGAELISIPLPNGGAYSLSNDGAITMGARVVNGIAEFYVNGLLLKKYTLLATPTEVAFLTASLGSSKCQILLPTKSSCALPNSSKPKKLAIVGDSISYGAWASESYDSILAKSLEHCGVGGVTTVNYAVSGSATSNWIAGGSIDITTKDVSDCDYTLIMLGTNDVQGGVTGTQYESNMRAIIANVVSQGSRPVLGVFPVWTQASVSGVTGVTTQNYAKGGWHRQIIKMLAAELGLPLADVCAKFGSNIQWYGDNIHPVEHGLIAVASAFAESIISDSCSSPIIPMEMTGPVKITPVLVNSWVAVSGQQIPTVRADMFGQVMLYGPITGGAVGSVITTLAAAYRPPFKRSFKIHLNDGATLNGYGRLDINADGTVVLSQSSITTPAVVFLDGATWAL